MERTEAGLSVPDGTAPKTTRTLRRDVLKQLRRFMLAMSAEDLRVIVVCKACGDPLTFEAIDKIDPKLGGGRVKAECKCRRAGEPVSR